MVAKFNQYYVDSDPERPFYPKFLGVPAMQTPTDMWVMQEIISEVAPDLIIECGTANGGSALYYASILERVNPTGNVITIDVAPWLHESIDGLTDSPHLQQAARTLAESRIEVITSSSIDPDLITKLTTRAAGKKVLVVLDSCHHWQHVLAEIEAYKDLVSVGSYLVVQDTIIDQQDAWIDRYAAPCLPEHKGRGGPGKAVTTFLKTPSNFAVDEEREKYLLTFFPSGYLKRMR